MKELVIQESGAIVRRTIFEVRVDLNVENYLSQRLKTTAEFLSPSLLSIPPLGVKALRLYFKTSGDPRPLVAFQLDALNLHTSWERQGDVLRPTFRQDGTQLNPAADKGIEGLWWKLPDFLELWFGLSLTESMLPGTASLAGFIASSPQMRQANKDMSVFKTVTPPLPNIHNDGKLCLGNQDNNIWRTVPPTAIDRGAACLRTWITAPWNLDLFDERKQAMFKALSGWSLDGKEQVAAPHERWWENMITVNPSGHADMAGFLACRYKEIALGAGLEK